MHIEVDGRSQAWTAKTKIEPGQVLRKYFSVKRYGVQAKPSQANGHRRTKEQLQQMEGVVIVHQAEPLGLLIVMVLLMKWLMETRSRPQQSAAHKRRWLVQQWRAALSWRPRAR